MSIDFVTKVEGCWEVKPKWHPRQVFLTCLIAFILAAMAVLLLVNRLGRWGHRIPNDGWLIWLALIGAWVWVISFGIWEDRGNAIGWDNAAIYIRQKSQWGRISLKFARIPYQSIESVQRRGKPPHEPTLLNLIEIVLQRENRTRKRHFFVDPNYFDASSLMVFFNDLKRKAPHLTQGERGEQFEKAVIQLQKKLRVYP